MCVQDCFEKFLRLFRPPERESMQRLNTYERNQSIESSYFNEGHASQDNNFKKYSSLSSANSQDGKSQTRSFTVDALGSSSRVPRPGTTLVQIQPNGQEDAERQKSSIPEIFDPFYNLLSSKFKSDPSPIPVTGGFRPPSPPKTTAEEEDPEKEFLQAGQNHHLGKLQFAVGYEYQLKHLTVRIIQAVDLPAMDITGTSDPYVKVKILPDKRNKVVTKIKHRKLNPKWNEIFIFEDFGPENLLTRTLSLHVYDYDRFSSDDVIGEISFPLFHLANENQKAETYQLWRYITPCKKTKGYVGEIQVSVCYKPQISQLSVTVIRAVKLKAMDINNKSDPYCKVQLIESRVGRRKGSVSTAEHTILDTRKTSVKYKTLEPLWNEDFDFTLPPNRLNECQVDIVVFDKDFFRNERIGRIRLGVQTSPEEAEHWKAMLKKPRQPVTMWHVLKH